MAAGAPGGAGGPSEADWAAAVEVLGTARSVVLLCHVGPDGDALGSMLALATALRDRGTDVVASFGAGREGEPFVVPPAFGFLPGLDLLAPPGEVPEAPELLVALDTSSADRLGSLAGLVDRAGTVLVVDHHASGQPFGTLQLVDPGAAATVVLVAELLDRLGLPIGPDVAAGLYTGLLTDTGSFTYAGTTPAVHALAGRLLATGIRHDLIARQLWDTTPFAYVRLLGEVCARARLEPAEVGGLGLVWTSVGADDLARSGLGLAEVEGVIDVLRTAEEAEVAVVVKQEPDRSALRVSTRSKGAVDLGAVCGGLGGGGHRFAAGFTSHDDLTATLDRLRAALAAAPHLAA